MDSLPVASAAALGVASALAWSVRGRSSAVFGPSLWRGNPARAAIALTFDDGPSESTPRLLEILARHKTSATFFQCGANVERLPAVAREVVAAGHAIGNHSQTHPLLCFRSPHFIEQDLRRAQETIQLHTGVTPVWFRAPFGVRWFGMRRAQRRLGLMGVMWTALGLDWKRSAAVVAGRLAARVSPGAILCLHDGRELRPAPDIGNTLEGVQRLIPLLLDRGYVFETIDALICPTT